MPKKHILEERKKILKKANTKLQRDGFPKEGVFWIYETDFDILAIKGTASGHTIKKLIKITKGYNNLPERVERVGKWRDEFIENELSNAEPEEVDLPEVEVWSWIERKRKRSEFVVRQPE